MADSQLALNQQETQRLEILSNALSRVPSLEIAKEITDQGRDSLLKAIGQQDSDVVVNGLRINPDVANDLNRSVRRASEEGTIRGVFRVEKVDATLEEGFRVTLRNIADGAEITATLQENQASVSHKQRIQAAEWGKFPVVVDMAVRIRRGTIVAAVVTDVKRAA